MKGSEATLEILINAEGTAIGLKLEQTVIFVPLPKMATLIGALVAACIEAQHRLDVNSIIVPSNLFSSKL